MESRIIVVGANVSLKPYLTAAAESIDFEAHMEKMGFEVVEEAPAHKIGLLEAAKRAI